MQAGSRRGMTPGDRRTDSPRRTAGSVGSWPTSSTRTCATGSRCESGSTTGKGARIMVRKKQADDQLPDAPAESPPGEPSVNGEKRQPVFKVGPIPTDKNN